MERKEIKFSEKELGANFTIFNPDDEDAKLTYLAEILVEAFLDFKKYEHSK